MNPLGARVVDTKFKNVKIFHSKNKLFDDMLSDHELKQAVKKAAYQGIPFYKYIAKLIIKDLRVLNE